MNKSFTLFLLLTGLLAGGATGWDTIYEYDGSDSDDNDSCCSGDQTCGDGGSCCGCGGSGHGDDDDDDYWAQVAGLPFEYTGKTRYYYVASEEVEWDYAPKGFNVITGQPFTGEEVIFTQRDDIHIGTKYIKCLYREYTSSSFKTLKSRTQQEKHLGFMGPTFRGEVGDIIKIEFLNRCRFPTSIHPHGVFYFKDGEGAPYADGTYGRDKKDDGVKKGDKFTYVWKVPQRAGPGPHDGSSVMWMYHSHHHEVEDFYAGLVGNMVIMRKGKMGKDGLPKDVDQEVFWMYSVADENSSPYIDDNIRKYALAGNVELSKSDPTFAQSNLKFAINGYIYGNAPLLILKKKTRVRWYIMSMGGFRDLHTPHWHGNVLLIDGMRMDVASLLPAEMMVADMVPDDLGVWLHHCHVHEHLLDGMITLYKVVP